MVIKITKSRICTHIVDLNIKSYSYDFCMSSGSGIRIKYFELQATQGMKYIQKKYNTIHSYSVYVIFACQSHINFSF